MIYAELRREGGGAGYFTLRYLVYNGDIIGSYGIHFSPLDHALSKPYGASRDFHRLATEQDLEDVNKEDSFVSIVGINVCEYHDNKPCVCDGSSLVEITDNEQRAFEIAAMMADIPNREDR